MADHHDPPHNKEELIARVNVAWDELDGSLGGLADGQLTEVRDASGWSAKDHLAHLAAWEASVVGLLRDRQPQYVGLGVDRATFETRDEDEVNSLMQAAARERSLADVRAELSDVHRRLLTVLTSMPEEELIKPIGCYVDGGSDAPVYQLINGNSWDHYDAHRAWIAELVRGEP